MNQLQDVYGVFLYHKQKCSSRIETGYSKMPRTAALVPKVLEPLLGHGCTPPVDNLYNSPDLAQQLQTENATDCVGTLKLNRSYICKEVEGERLKKGENVVKYLGPVTMLNDVTKEM